MLHRRTLAGRPDGQRLISPRLIIIVSCILYKCVHHFWLKSSCSGDGDPCTTLVSCEEPRPQGLLFALPGGSLLEETIASAADSPYCSELQAWLNESGVRRHDRCFREGVAFSGRRGRKALAHGFSLEKHLYGYASSDRRKQTADFLVTRQNSEAAADEGAVVADAQAEKDAGVAEELRQARVLAVGPGGRPAPVKRAMDLGVRRT